MQPWEYLQVLVNTNRGGPEVWEVTIDGTRHEWGRLLQAYGTDGWELVGLTQTSVKMAPASVEFVALFKRPFRQ